MMTAVTHRLRFLAMLLMAMTIATACDVHEWYTTDDEPDNPTPPPTVEGEKGLYSLRFDFNPHFNQVDMQDDGTLGDVYRTYDNTHSYGWMHYYVRAYPLTDGNIDRNRYQEFTFSRDVAEGYQCKYLLELCQGDYRIMVWTHLTEQQNDDHFYDVSDFGEIRLAGTHTANTDYRDAFRGSVDITVRSTDGHDANPTPSTTLVLERPLAKFEIITNDITSFLTKAGRGSLDDYQVVVTYIGFMPNAFSMHTDRNVDSSQNIQFVSELNQLSEDEASLGFDYVFVNSSETYVTVQVSIVAKSRAKAVANSDPVRIPLQRNHHTVVRGSFLLKESSGGVGINPDYDGDFNINAPLN